MPNKKSAERRVRVAERNRLYNRYWTTRCKTALKRLMEAVESKDSEAAAKNFNLAQSVIDKAVVKGVMPRNTATRRKKLMARCLKSLSAPAGSEA
ncbi:MAG: 30S ribosomal protein S20 [Fretibacterium sp.]|nr:30S ribosomal protein S20 [Fretibacterium sp.]